MIHKEYPPREKAVIDENNIETPESPRPIDAYMRPDNIPQEIWDTFTDAQKKAHIATFNAIKIHAEKHGRK